MALVPALRAAVQAIDPGVPRREVGVRMAVGAGAGDVLRLVMRQGACWWWLASRSDSSRPRSDRGALTALLFGISARDPGVFAGVAVPLGAVGLLACYLPARRAARTSLLEALRQD